METGIRYFRLINIPDLTLIKYSSLEESGVSGVLEKHIAFLRLLNRKGIVSNMSFHLFYMYIKADNGDMDQPGNRLEIIFAVKGSLNNLGNIDPIIKKSPMADFFMMEEIDSISELLNNRGIKKYDFQYCNVLSKFETTLLSSDYNSEEYYFVRSWNVNENGRLYNMLQIMEAYDESCVYRVDLYPVDANDKLRKTLSRPMSILRARQQDFSHNVPKDYSGKDTLSIYEDYIETYESSPHFFANIVVFSNNSDVGISILDAAGAESLLRGRYNIATFYQETGFNPQSLLNEENIDMIDQTGTICYRKYGAERKICLKDKVNNSLSFLPTLLTIEDVSPFFRFPTLYDGEHIQKPKETDARIMLKENSIYLGKDEYGYDVFFPLDKFPKHAFVSGVPGSGKTNTMFHVISELHKKDIPFLVLEPAKKEYRALLNSSDMTDIFLFSPNASMNFPLHINPFEMPVNCIVSEHIQMLKEVFEGAFTMENPMPFLLDQAIESVYMDTGWNYDHVYTGKDENVNDDKKQKRRFPTMKQFYHKLEELVEKTDYGDENKGNLKSALNVRIGSLLQREMGDLYDVDESTFKPEEWLTKSVIIELESMGVGPANFLNLLLCALIREALKVSPIYDKSDVRHVILIEEAHNLIGSETESEGDSVDAKVSATAFVVNMLAEVRALKEGIIIADQLPTKMAPEVIKNTGLKLALRITAQDDRKLIGESMSASQLQLEELVTFEPGNSLIFYEGLMKPFKIQIQKYQDETTSLTDRDLMTKLRNNKNYCDVLEKSIEIYCRKCFREFISLEKEQNSFADYCNLRKYVLNKLDELNDQENQFDYRNQDEYVKIQYKLDYMLEKENDMIKLCRKIIIQDLRIYNKLKSLYYNRWKKCVIKKEIHLKYLTSVQIMTSEIKNMALLGLQIVGETEDDFFDDVIKIAEEDMIKIDKEIQNIKLII